MNKKRIAIVAGGDSSEHNVSLRSAAGLYSFMNKDLYNIRIVVLTGSDWRVYVGDYSAAELADGMYEQKYWNTDNFQTIDKNDFSYVRAGEKHGFDYAYITIHGVPGESGQLQGYFDMLRIPYSCCGVFAASITCNKYACNHYLHGFGFDIATSILLRSTDDRQQWHDRVINEVGLPCFIKSNTGGSSYGCTKVKTSEEILPAIDKAFAEGKEVIVEAFMKGTEVTCGVYVAAGKQVAFPLTEVVAHNEYFDYDAKYKGESDEITPARLPEQVSRKVQDLTLRLYKILGCHGIIRTDYILTEDGRMNVMDINTTPGMTATSFIPQQVRAAGLNITDVLTEIIEN